MDFVTNILGRALGGWTSLALLVGLAIVAACLLVPQLEENRELRWERDRLQAEKARIDEQVAANKHFIEVVGSDVTLQSRLVQRQFQLRPSGTEALDIPGVTEPRSPFQLATVPPPEAVAPYQPVGGAFLDILRQGRARLYFMGLGLIIMAAGLILDGGRAQRYQQAQRLAPPMEPSQPAAPISAPTQEAASAPDHAALVA
jgi:hypothetical protein